jgi:hypothetical protein
MSKWGKGSRLFSATLTPQQRSDFSNLEIQEGLSLTALRDGLATAADALLLQNMAALAVALNPTRHELSLRVYQGPTYAEAAALWKQTCADRRTIPVKRFEAVLAQLKAQASTDLPPDREWHRD